MQPKNQRVPLEMEHPNQPVPPPVPPGEAVDVGDLRDKIVAALQTCYDPEIPVNIHELGLIYGIDIQDSGDVTIRMTLTSPACPVAGSLPGEVQAKVQGLPGVKSARAELVWEPPWSPDRMSEAAKVQLGLF